MKEIIGIIGAGAFGSSLAHAFAAAHRDVLLWCRSNKQRDEINSNRSNRKYMGELTFDKEFPRATSDIEELINQSTIIVYACPSHQLHELLGSFVKVKSFSKKLFVNTAKGLDLEDLCTFDHSVKVLLGKNYWKNNYAVLSGPSFAKEIIQGHPTCLTLASRGKTNLKRLQSALGTRFFRVYTTNDLCGVQLGGAMKNVIAIAAGVSEGLNLGVNTKAAIINLGLGEMTRLGSKMKAKAITFRGFSGMGDLVLTCTGPLSRNRRFGALLGEGNSAQQAQKTIASTIEGISTAKVVYGLSQKHGIELPISQEVYRFIYEGKEISKGMDDLLNRPLLEEWR